MLRQAETVLLTAALTAVWLAGAAYAQDKQAARVQIEAAADGIISWRADTGDAQRLADTYLVTNAATGNTEWYAVALAAAGTDISAYATALKAAYTLPEAQVNNKVERQRVALALSAAGGYDDEVITAVSETAGKQGIMSLVFALITADSRAYDVPGFERSETVDDILSLRLESGGWALSGQYPDADVTAMVLQALAPYTGSEEVGSAVNAALSLLSGMQDSGGGFASYGSPNCESCAQVLIALCALNIDVFNDERFIKNGNTLLDALMTYRDMSGAFVHKIGAGVNDKASAQALCALTALSLRLDGKGFVYDFTGTAVQQKPGVPPQSASHSEAVASVQQSDSFESTGADSQPQLTSETQQSTAQSGSEQSGGTVSISGEDAQSLPDEPSAEPSSEPSEGSVNNKGAVNIKAAAFIILLCAAVLCAAVLAVTKKLNKRSILILLAVFAVLCAALWVSDIKTVSQYRGEAQSTGEPSVGTVTVSVDCSAAVSSGHDGLPESGFLIEPINIPLINGDTALSVLLRAAASSSVTVESEGTAGAVISTAYVEGIGGLYEFDCGELSGWRYVVNGEYPELSAGEYTLCDGDNICWVYVTQYGEVPS